MKNTTVARRLTLVLSGVALSAAAFVPALSQADVPGVHPAYLHAISDLRAARWMIEHRPGDWKRTGDEVRAVREIDAALGEIKRAALDDGKNLEDHPAVDERPDQRGRLHEAVDFLRKARADIEHEEDNYGLNGLRGRAIGHIDRAINATSHAIHE